MAHRIARTGIAVLGIIALAGACARPVPVAGGAPAPDAAATDTVAEVLAPTLLRVVNHHWSDVIISVTHGGLTSRLGLVSATTNATLTLPKSWLNTAASITITARAVGGARRGSTESFQTRPTVVRAGQQLELTLESGLQRSSISIY
jgi:hypothetical protein